MTWLDWLIDHAAFVSALLSLGMLVVWLLYLQLFYSSLRRQTRPNLLIHQAGGFGGDSLCMVANLSERAVHVAAVLIDVRTERETTTWVPAPRRRVDPDDDRPLGRLLQGPLATGEYLTLGRFRDLLREAAGRLGGKPDADTLGQEFDLDVRVVAFVGPTTDPTGARRRFRVRLGPRGAEVRPAEVVPVQMSSRRQRREARRWLEASQRLDPAERATPDGVTGPRRDPAPGAY